MTKKILIVFFVLFGLTVGTVGVLAQEVVPDQPATPYAPVPLLPQLSVDDPVVPEMNLRPGARNPHVMRLQEVLKFLGYLPADLRTTENFGSRTREAVRRFQRDKGLPSTGFFGPATRDNLKSRLIREREAPRAVIDRNVDIACMKTEVEKRENAFLTAYGTFSQKERIARETRKTDLLAAWLIQDPRERHAALRTAWNKYRQTIRAASTEWRQSKETIWSQSTQDVRRCRASAIEMRDLDKLEE